MTIKQLYPTQRPALDLNFARQKRLDPRVTFTRASTATYVGSDGLIKTAASGEARFDHDPVTGESLGLLLEEARTNLIENSDTLSSFTTGTCSRQLNAGVSVDGTFTATKIIESSLNEHQYVTNNVDYNIENSAATFTIFLKAGERTNASVTIGIGNALASINVDLTNGSYNTFTNSSPWWTNVTYDVTPFPNSWYKVRITGTTSYSANYVYLYPCINGSAITNTGGTNVYQGDGTSGFYVAFSQLEAGSFPTSYIPTDGTPGGILRAADVASMTGTNFSSWYNQSEGTIYARFSSSKPSAATYGPFVISDGTANNRLIGVNNITGTDAEFNVVSSGVTEARLVFNNAGAAISSASAYKLNDCGFSVNGGAALTDTSATIPTVNQLGFGYFFPGSPASNTINGTISRLAYYPTRLSDTQLQALTL